MCRKSSFSKRNKYRFHVANGEVVVVAIDVIFKTAYSSIDIQHDIQVNLRFDTRQMRLTPTRRDDNKVFLLSTRSSGLSV